LVFKFSKTGASLNKPYINKPVHIQTTKPFNQIPRSSFIYEVDPYNNCIL